MISITGNEPIYEAQRFLRALHFDTDGVIPLVSPDGIYGSRTREAVNEFQRLYGLPVTGKIDYETWTALYRAYVDSLTRSDLPLPLDLFPTARGYTVAPGEKSDIAYIVQFILRALADSYADIDGADPTGVYDDATRNDIRRFQRYYRLPETGLTDRNTWNRLTEAYRKNSYQYQ